MNDLQDLRKALIRTCDGISVIMWSLVFVGLAARSIAINGLALQQSKYIFFSLIVLLIFSRFRVIDFRSELKSNAWGVMNINSFGVFVVFMEFFK